MTMATVDRPLVHAKDVQIGAYLADHDGKRLYQILDIHTLERDGRSTQVAMLEDTVTEDIAPWDFVELAGLRVVTPNG